jgi:ankyrin repeat domain-containing protein 50
VAVNNQEQQGALLLTTEKAIRLCDRARIYEMLYRPDNTPDEVRKNLYRELVDLYFIVLTMIAHSFRVATKASRTTPFTAIFTIDEIKDLLEKCDSLEKNVDIEAANCDRAVRSESDSRTQQLIQSLHANLHEMNLPILRTDENVEALLDNAANDEELRVLEWISNVPYGKHHKTVSDSRTATTCEWISNHAKFVTWHSSSRSSLLWLQGIRKLPI